LLNLNLEKKIFKSLKNVNKNQILYFLLEMTNKFKFVLAKTILLKLSVS